MTSRSGRNRKTEREEGSGDELEKVTATSEDEASPSAILAAIRKMDESMAARFDQLESSLRTTQATLHENTQRIDELEHRHVDHDSRIQALEERCDGLADANKAIRLKMDDLEGRSRRNNIRILGIPEKAEKGNPTQFIADLIPTVLGATSFPHSIKVDRGHRIGRLTNDSARPRVLIARIHHFPEKETIIRLARAQQPLRYEGARIYIYPDYPVEVMKKRQAFDGVLKKLRGSGVVYGLYYPARLRVSHGSTDKSFLSPCEAERFVDSFLSSAGGTSSAEG